MDTMNTFDLCLSSNFVPLGSEEFSLLDSWLITFDLLRPSSSSRFE